jgi:hypothetical protein
MLFGLVNGLNRALVIKLKTAKALGIDVPAAVPTSDPLGADFAAVRFSRDWHGADVRTA